MEAFLNSVSSETLTLRPCAAEYTSLAFLTQGLICTREMQRRKRWNKGEMFSCRCRAALSCCFRCWAALRCDWLWCCRCQGLLKIVCYWKSRATCGPTSPSNSENMGAAGKFAAAFLLPTKAKWSACFRFLTKCQNSFLPLIYVIDGSQIIRSSIV